MSRSTTVSDSESDCSALLIQVLQLALLLLFLTCVSASASPCTTLRPYFPRHTLSLQFDVRSRFSSFGFRLDVASRCAVGADNALEGEDDEDEGVADDTWCEGDVDDVLGGVIAKLSCRVRCFECLKGVVAALASSTVFSSCSSSSLSNSITSLFVDLEFPLTF